MTSARGKGWERWRTVIRDRAALVLGTVTAIGGALVALGWVMQGASYVPGLLQQLGSSLMLLVPLALLGFMLEGRLQRTEEQLRATAQQLDTLTSVTRQRLAESRRQQEQMFDAAKRAPSRSAIHTLLADAARMRAIDLTGVRVRVPGSELRLRFRTRADDILAVAEEADGTVLGQIEWDSGETAESFAQELAEVLRNLGCYPGDAAYDPAGILQRLLEIVQLGIKSRIGEQPSDLGHLIEVPNEHWAISAEGLYSLRQHYHIPAHRITGAQVDWQRHMRSLVWVDTVAFDEAYVLARHLLART